jgi:serine/threonine protein kinase
VARMPLRDGDPSRIGRYRLTARLGAGGMGVVYLGTAKDGSQAAIKVLRPELADDQEFRVRFRREVAVLARIQGLCTVRVIEADTESARPFLATEYAEGPSLSEHVTACGPLPPQMLYGLATGLAEALVAIHAAGVVHRDLKPSNVLLTQAGPKVIDFGIAQALDTTAVTGTGMTVGSPGFMAPEQITGQAGPPADVFSWALTVGYAASGQPPFGTGPTDAIMYRILHDGPNIEAVPAELRTVIEAALAKSPADRPAARDLLGRLTQQPDAPGDTPTQSVLSRTWLPPASEPAAVGRQRRIRPLPVLAGAAALAIAVGAATAFVASSSPHPNPGSSAAGSHSARTTLPASPTSTDPAGSPSSSAAAAGTIAALPTVTIGSYSGTQPSVINMSSGRANQVQNIDWSSWTATNAYGQGVSYDDNCIPDCAGGTITPVPVQVTLSDPVSGRFSNMSETREGTTTSMTYPGATWPYGASPAASTCPAAGQVMSAFRAALPATKQSWGKTSSVSSFKNVQCWKDWVVASAVGNGDGAFVFSQSSVLHLIPAAELQEFDTQVCPDPNAPSGWKNYSTGPATC